jgi:outer membrane immunogenic protein
MRGFTKTLISSVALSVGLTMAAAAADMPVKAPAPLPPVSNWTGFYLGADIGAMALNAKANTVSVTGFGAAGPTALIPFEQPVNYNSVGFRGGVFGGYDMQFSSWVAGLEADWHGENNKDTQPGYSVGLPSGPIITTRGDNRQIAGQWDASVRARLGYLVTPDFLLFVTGGPAWEHVKVTAFCDGLAVGGVIGYCANFGFPSQTITGSTTRSGWTIGGGIETMLSPHWVARAEYRYSSFGTMTVAETIALGALAQTNTYGVRLNTNVGEVGLRYKF